MNLLSNIINPITVGIGLWGAVLAFFWKIEDVTSPPAKEAVSNWIKKLKVSESLSSWPQQFVALFDRVFGERHFTFKCFFRSCIASMGALTIISIITITINPNTVHETTNNLIKNDFLAILIVGIILFLNLIPDYFSLWESRYIIGRMAKTKSIGAKLGCLTIDLIFSIAIFIVGMLVFIILGLLIGFAIEGEPPKVGKIWWSIDNMLLLFYTKGIYLEERQGAFLLGIPFYSTFFTSVWVWLYALSGGFLRLASSTRRVLKFLKWFLDIEKHPLRSMGTVGGGISAGSYWLMIVFSSQV